MRRKSKYAEDELAGVFPLLRRGPGGIPLPPKPPTTGTTTTGTTTTTTTTTPGTKPGTDGKPGYGAGTKPGGGGKDGSGGVSTYQGYLNAQKAAAAKSGRKTANKYIMDAEGLRAQANALLTLLGRRPGGGANPFHVGGGGGNQNGQGSGSIHGNVNWQGGTGWKPDGSGPKRPGQGGGIRTGTDVIDHLPPKHPGGYHPGNMGRTTTGRNAQVEGTGGGDNTRKDQDKNHGGGKHFGDRLGQGGKDKKNDDKRGDRNLRDRGLSGELKTNLKNVERAMQTADDLLMSQYGERVASLGKAAGDNEQAVNAQGYANISNRGRERANAISEIAAQGAGESDAARAQGMSLRNWEQNQNDVNRSFFDTLTTINSSLKDTTIDTRTARVQNKQNALDDKQQLWNSYFDAKSEALTQLGNTYGQMATDYGNANEASTSKKAQKRQKRLQRKSGHAFMKAAQVGSQSHKEPGVEDELTNWKGAADFEGKLNNNTVQQSGQRQAAPEGATLRKWNA